MPNIPLVRIEAPDQVAKSLQRMDLDQDVMSTVSSVNFQTERDLLSEDVTEQTEEQEDDGLISGPPE